MDRSEIVPPIGERLRTYRQHRQYSMEKMLREGGLTPPALKNLENDRGQYQSLLKACRILGINPKSLIVTPLDLILGNDFLYNSPTTIEDIRFIRSLYVKPEHSTNFSTDPRRRPIVNATMAYGRDYRRK